MTVDSLAWTITTVFLLSKASSPSGVSVPCGGLSGVVGWCVWLATPMMERRCLERLKRNKKRHGTDAFNLAAENTQKLQLSTFLLYLKDFVVEVILKGFAVFRVLFFLLELFVGFGAGAAARPLALLLRLVPLLLLVVVHLSGHP